MGVGHGRRVAVSAAGTRYTAVPPQHRPPLPPLVTGRKKPRLIPVVLPLVAVQPFSGVLRRCRHSPSCCVACTRRAADELALPAFERWLAIWNVLHCITSRALNRPHPLRWPRRKFRQDGDDQNTRCKQSSEGEPSQSIAILRGGNHGGNHTADEPKDDEATSHIN